MFKGEKYSNLKNVEIWKMYQVKKGWNLKNVQS